jgi:uncharacterized ubiquitin-like protein YukD
MKKLLTTLFVSSLIFGMAQQHLFLGFQGEYGMLTKNFNQSGAVLYTDGLGSMSNGKLSIQYRLFDALSFEMGAGIKRIQWKLKDKNFEARNPGFEVNSKTNAVFGNYFANIQYAHKIQPKQFIYFQLAYTNDLVGAESLTQSRNFTVGSELVSQTTDYAESNWGITPEIGFQMYDLYGNLMSLGLSYNNAIGSDMLVSNYSVTNGSGTVASDVATANGSYFALNARFNLLVFHRLKKEKPPKEDKIKEETADDIIVDIPDTTTIKDPVDVIDNSNQTNDDKINDREIVTTHKIKVHSPNLTIKIYDHQIVDGDIVSLYLNDKWIVENYTLKKEYLELKITVDEGDNSLILYAINLGRYKPNTAAIIINDGVKDHTVILESDLEESGTLEIKYKPEKKK